MWKVKKVCESVLKSVKNTLEEDVLFCLLLFIVSPKDPNSFHSC